jgi:hypothetical protein
MKLILFLMAASILTSCASKSARFQPYREPAYICGEERAVGKCHRTYEHIDNSIFFKNSDRELSTIEIPK